MDVIEVAFLLGLLAVAVFFGLMYKDKSSQEEFYIQMDKIKGDIFSHIDKNTTNTEIVDMINSKCEDRFTDAEYNQKTRCVRELQDLFIISIRD